MEETSQSPEREASSRMERRVKAAEDVLRTLIRDTYAHHCGAGLPKEEDLELVLKVKVTPGQAWATTFDPAPLEQLSPQLADAQAGRDVYRRGRVYCFRSESADVDATRPPGPGYVFKGYDETGRPEWAEFHQVLLDAKDERVGQLYDQPARRIALVQRGKDVRGRQLSSFGRASKTYSILGQVVAGYFPMPGTNGKTGVDQVAVSLQVVESRDRRGRLLLHLNPVIALPGETSLAERWAMGWAPELAWAIGQAEQALASMEQTVRAFRQAGQSEAANREMGRVPSILRKMAEAIERGGRQAHRRTRHVVERRRDRRPVHKAFDDAAIAPPEAWRYDEKAETMVVVGSRGRAHAFSEEGKHVTSFVIRDEAVQMRERTGRWRPVSSEEWTPFQRLLEKMRSEQGRWVEATPENDDADES